MNREELFFICMLTGAEFLFGIEDMIEGLNIEEAQAKWLKVSEHLMDKKILSYGENGEMFLDQECAKFAAILSFPDQVFACLIEEGGTVTTEFIYSRCDVYTSMKGEVDCTLKLYQEQEACVELMKESFLLTECDAEVELTLPAATVESIVTLVSMGAAQSAKILLEPYELGSVVTEDLVQAFYENPDIRIIAGYNLLKESRSEAFFTCARTQKGTWIVCVKPDKDQVVLFRLQIHRAIANLLNFQKV